MQFLLANGCDSILPDLYKGLRDAGNCAQLQPITSFEAIGTILTNVIQIALSVAGLLAVGFIVAGGIQYIMSQGQPDRIKKAKDTIVNAVIGLVLTIMAYVIVGLVANVFTGKIV